MIYDVRLDSRSGMLVAVDAMLKDHDGKDPSGGRGCLT